MSDAKFEEMKLRCAVREEQWVTVTRFINGPRDDLKGEVILHHPESLMEAYQKAIEIETYNKSSFCHKWTFQAGESSLSSQPTNIGKGSYFTSNLVNSSSARTICHKRHERGHPASHCPYCALTIAPDNLEEHELMRPSIDDIVAENEHEEDEGDNRLSFIRCLLSCVDHDSWKRTAIFETKMSCAEKILHLVSGRM
ncbi:LOW QUALITY PROTEIN: hypothetical protein Cgig2_020652 [Carnegiea gigantea]|uniref:Uncharacterized protein n=1 Tax=Carnegiea gigantea TaxID=171969 RepID=A0A9Q1QKM1_9CARY|nr:LOW QUALITY PROTEIN: hypothetical protein Cgig2_020652 [Carnegiea gigantea]